MFVVPLMGVDRPAGQWSGTIQFSNYRDEAQWFDSYWKTYQPYVEVAARSSADQLAIATEMDVLQRSGPPALWNTLIARIRSVFKGPLTYDMNWSGLDQAPPSWMSNTQAGGDRRSDISNWPMIAHPSTQRRLLASGKPL